jgi:predicted kinase
MAKVVIVVGLPGSGKSHFVKSHRSQYNGLVVCDYFKDSLVPTLSLPGSRHYQDLLKSLREGRDCLIADIAFCQAPRRAETVRILAELVPAAIVEWVFFENNSEACRANIERDGGGQRAQDRLEYLAKFAPDYSIPPGVEPLRVWQPIA